MGQNWGGVKSLVARALALPDAEREAFVVAHCDDRDVRRDALELLKSTDRLSRFPSAPLNDPEPDIELAPGTRIGTYTILDTIGHGGMGRVYLAKDARLHRKVALKSLLTPGQSGDEDRAKVLREARTAAQINHPNVATIHEFLEVDDRAFIVMEYVEGQSLSASVRREPFSAERVIAIGRQLANGLTAAHAKGVIHRDLKPGNVKLTDDGSAKILDFGVAALTSAFTTMSTPGDAQDHPLAGQPGTLGYMAPEQLLSNRCDERSDIFSLGIVLFEMATGEPAYPSRERRDLAQAMTRPLRRADAVDSRVPRALGEVIARAVDPDPARRFATAGALQTALKEIERTQTGTAGTGSTLTDPTRSTIGARVARGLFYGLAGASAVTALGYLNSQTFNLALERVDFANETIPEWFVWGFKSCVPILAMVLVAFAAVALLVMARNLALTLFRRARAIDTLRGQLDRTTRRLGFDDPAVLASWLLLGFVVVLGGTWWWYAPYLAALFGRISEASPETLAPLAEPAENYRQLYQIILTTLIVVGTLAWARLGPPLLRIGAGSGRALFVGGCAVLVLALVSLQLPYRFFLEASKFDQVEWNGANCFLLGERGNEALVFCPSLPRRRNVVTDREKSLKNHGEKASIFKPL